MNKQPMTLVSALCLALCSALCLAACANAGQQVDDEPDAATDAPPMPVDAAPADAAPPDATPVDAAPADAAPPPDRIITGNNSAILRGDSFPNPGADNTPLRKTVPFVVNNQHPDIVLDTAYITRGEQPETLIEFILRATNTGTVTHCFISANNILYQRGDGSTVTDPGLAYITGSVQTLNAGGAQTAACLRPGEHGYFLDLFLDGTVYDELASVEFDMNVSTSDASTDPLGECLPLSYSYGVAEGLEVPFENIGTGSCTVAGGFSRWLLLDSDDAPLWWIFLTDGMQPPNGIVAPGNTGAVTRGDPDYAGTGEAIHAWIDFEDTTAMAHSRRPISESPESFDPESLDPESLDPGQRMVDLWRLRNRREFDKERRLTTFHAGHTSAQ